MTPAERAARERKQKIFVAVGGLFLVALLAVQLPKLLGGASSTEAAPATTEALSGQPAPSDGATVTLVEASPAVTSGKLSSLSVFARKDPFVQQVAPDDRLGEATGDGTTAAPDGSTKSAEKPDTTTFATRKTAAAAATVVTVNGTRQVLEQGMKFPAGDPMFVLVAEKPGTKSVAVGIVGGAFAGGAKTTTLKVGRPLTLVNTTTGARYKISLVSVGSGGDADEQSTRKR